MAAFGEVQARACSSKTERSGPRPRFAPASNRLYAVEWLDAAKKRTCDVEPDIRNACRRGGDNARGRFFRLRFLRPARAFSAPLANRQNLDLSAPSALALRPAGHSVFALRLLQPTGHCVRRPQTARLERDREFAAGAR